MDMYDTLILTLTLRLAEPSSSLASSEDIFFSITRIMNIGLVDRSE